MSVVRAFVALELPESLERELDKIAHNLRRELADMPLRWVKVSNIHLTLKFLGPVEQADLPKVERVVREQAARFGPIEMSLEGLGAFPNPIKPLVLWVGARASSNLAQLQQAIEEELSKVGFAAEGRAFSPHLTLARVRRDHRVANLKRIGTVLAAASVPQSPAVTIDEVTLFRSDLKPGGSVYNPLVTAKLTGRT